MPAKRMPRKSRNNRKQNRANQVQAFGTTPLLPSNRIVTLAYNEIIGLVEAAVGTGIHSTFSLNSLYDPNSGGVGKQPVGFDQIMTMYGQFRVLSARFKLTFANDCTANVFCGTFGTYQAAVPADPTAWPCQPYGRSVLVEKNGSACSRVLQIAYDIPKVLGLTTSQYRSDMDFIGTASGNPTRQAYAVVWVRSAGQVVATTNVVVQISYTVEFSQPLALNIS